MVAPGMLQNPSVKHWLGGVEPAWTLLDQASLAALREPPSPTAGPIRLAADLTEEEVEQSAVARNALILLRAATAGPGLKMTATGNLSRGVVAEMWIDSRGLSSTKPVLSNSTRSLTNRTLCPSILSVTLLRWARFSASTKATSRFRRRGAECSSRRTCKRYRQYCSISQCGISTSKISGGVCMVLSVSRAPAAISPRAPRSRATAPSPPQRCRRRRGRTDRAAPLARRAR